MKNIVDEFQVLFMAVSYELRCAYQETSLAKGRGFGKLTTEYQLANKALRVSARRVSCTIGFMLFGPLIVAIIANKVTLNKSFVTGSVVGLFLIGCTLFVWSLIAMLAQQRRSSVVIDSVEEIYTDFVTAVKALQCPIETMIPAVSEDSVWTLLVSCAYSVLESEIKLHVLRKQEPCNFDELYTEGDFRMSVKKELILTRAAAAKFGLNWSPSEIFSEAERRLELRQAK